MSRREFAVAMTVLTMVMGTVRDTFGKPPSAPVTVEVEVPPNIKQGDEVTSVLTLRALADIDRLDVSVAPFMGLEVVSRPTAATFERLAKGEGRTFTVTIRLTDAKAGSLAVLYRTVRGNTKAAGATTVVY